MKTNLNLNTNPTALSRVDHTARMDRLETALDERSVRLRELGPEDLAKNRAFNIRILQDIDHILQFPPRRPHKPATRLFPGPLDPYQPIKPLFPNPLGPTTPSTPEERTEELKELIREKTDPDFAAKKKAQRTARQLASLFSSQTLLFGGETGIKLPKANRTEQRKHNNDKAIINLLFTLGGKELEMVKTEFEKSQGKTLEGAVRERFRGDVQQALLQQVRGGKDNKGSQR